MATYYLYERITAIRVHVVEADDPAEAKDVMAQGHSISQVPDPTSYESLGLATIAIVDQRPDPFGRRYEHTIWDEYLGWKCPGCGYFEGNCGCPREPAEE